MRITEIETTNVTRLHAREDQWVTDRYRSIKADGSFVTVRTDDGLVGIGEACAYGNPAQIAEWVQWYAAALVGRDPLDPDLSPKPLGADHRHGDGSAHDFAAAGIDCALWDLRARAAGVPVSRLIDADADSEVVIYASGGVRYDWRGDPTTLIDDVTSYAAAGYRHAKIRLGTAWAWDGVTPERFLDLFDRVRKEVGDDFGLAVDANSRLSRDEALRLARGLSERGALFLEEPLAKDDLEGYAGLTAAVDLRITGCESLTTVAQVRPWIERGAVSVVQPDAGITGITELLAIGRVAAEHGVEVIPHSWHNGLMCIANAHAVAALPNASMVEEGMAQGPLAWAVLAEGKQVRDGLLDTATGPGFGVTLAEGLAERYPYIEGHYSVEVFR